MSKVDVLSFGETMAMWVAEQTGDLAQVERFHKRIAGADSNVAIGLARLGFNVAWLSRVGADSLGRFVRATLQAEGLNCQHVETDPQHPTGLQLKSRVDDGSDPQVEYFRRGSAASHLNRSAITPQLLGAGHLHATGIPPALSASCRELSFELMQGMRAAGRTVSFDPNLRPSLWASEQQMIRDINALAAHADWVLPGLSEGRLLTGRDDPADIARFYLDQGAEAVIIKLGPKGACGGGDRYRRRRRRLCGGRDQCPAGKPWLRTGSAARQLDWQPRRAKPWRHGRTADPRRAGGARPHCNRFTCVTCCTRDLLRQKQQAQELRHAIANTRCPPVVVHHADRIHHL